MKAQNNDNNHKLSNYSLKCQNNNDTNMINNSHINQSFNSINISNEISNNSGNLENIIYNNLQELSNSLINPEISQEPKIEENNQMKDNQNYKLFENDDCEKDDNKNMNNDSKINYYDESDNSDDYKNEKNVIKLSNLSSLQSINIINNNYGSKIDNKSKQTFTSNRKELISSLKSGNISFNKRYSVVQSISKLNSILSSRNTISFMEKPNYLSLAYILSNRNNDNDNSIKILILLKIIKIIIKMI